MSFALPVLHTKPKKILRIIFFPIVSYLEVEVVWGIKGTYRLYYYQSLLVFYLLYTYLIVVFDNLQIEIPNIKFWQWGWNVKVRPKPLNKYIETKTKIGYKFSCQDKIKLLRWARVIKRSERGQSLFSR